MRVIKMASRYKFSNEEIKEIEKARKENKDKRAEARLKALELRAKGAAARDVAEATGFHAAYVSQLVAKYRKNRLEAISGNHYDGNHRNMSVEEEAAILAPFKARAEKGELVEISEIAKAYQRAVDHPVSNGQIYFILHWHRWRKAMPHSRHPQKASEEEFAAQKNLNLCRKTESYTQGIIRLMFQDEAGFGRINKPKYCWCEKGVRSSVPCYHIREYRYAYGAVEPVTGNSFFLIMPYCNTACMNVFLRKLSEQYPEDMLLLCCDGAAWHKSAGLDLPENIILFHIPPYTPEMNPIEQIWKEIRKRGFRNEVFATLEKAIDRLCDTICSLSNNIISSVTGRDWAIKAFN